MDDEMQHDSSPVLETERLVLRMLRLDDAAAIPPMVDEVVARNTLSFTYPFTEAQARDWILKAQMLSQADMAYVFAVTLKPDDVFIGSAGTFRDSDFEQPTAGIGYWMGKPYRRNGYMGEAVRAVLRFDFETLGVEQVYGDYFYFNPVSRYVMEKVGMTYSHQIQIDKNGTIVTAGRCTIDRATFTP